MSFGRVAAGKGGVAVFSNKQRLHVRVVSRGCLAESRRAVGF